MKLFHVNYEPINAYINIDHINCISLVKDSNLMSYYVSISSPHTCFNIPFDTKEKAISEMNDIVLRIEELSEED
jgi:hypothetical protein